MKYFTFFEIPNLKVYQKEILDYYYNVHEYDCIFGNFDTELDCMKMIRRKKLQEIVPGLIDFFDEKGLHLSFLETLEIAWNTMDPYDHIHIDHSPVTEDYFHADYSINFSLENTEHSHLVLFDQEQKEVARVNYDHCPVLFRSNGYHSVIKSTDDLRLTVALRFDEKNSLEKYFDL